MNPTGLTAGGNLFLASGTGGVLGRYNSVDRTTLADWQTATGVDANSLNTDPLYLNPTGDAATVDLHLQSDSPASQAGLALAVLDDFDGDLRSTTMPNIGADEFVADIAVAQAAPLTDGESTVDFGAVTNGGSSNALTFTITNPGGADLTSLAVTKDGAHAADFTVSALSGTSVPAATAASLSPSPSRPPPAARATQPFTSPAMSWARGIHSTSRSPAPASRPTRISPASV